jgi:hypothetical protein
VDKFGQAAPADQISKICSTTNLIKSETVDLATLACLQPRLQFKVRTKERENQAGGTTPCEAAKQQGLTWTTGLRSCDIFLN